MTTRSDAEFAELERTVAELRRRLDESRSAYAERIDHQSATVDVLKAMSASPGDPRPVFDQIVGRAAALCNANAAALFEFDGELVRFTAFHSDWPTDTEAYASYVASFPMAPNRGSISCRAILDRAPVHVRDTDLDAELASAVKGVLQGRQRSQVSIPLLRDGRAIGAVSLGAAEPGGFTDSQVALLETFAEQAVIAITSAETYRALQARTTDLQESLEYQTATSDVLKVISRSTFDLQPVLDTVAETAARLCDADQAAIARFEDDQFRFAANFGYPPEYAAYQSSRGVFPLDRNAPNVSARAILEGRTVHIHDTAAVPGYLETSARLGNQRTALGVPILRDDKPIGVIVLARQRVEPFTERQIKLVGTFADQAVIAIENTRLLTEQREALEQQTATAEVLQVINASPGDLEPVFDAMLERALRLCGAASGAVHTYDGERFQIVATKGVTPAFAAFRRQNQMPAGPDTPPGEAAIIRRPVQVTDVLTHPFFVARPELQDAQINLGGIRAVLNLPLVKDDTTVGMFVIYRKEPGVFPEKQIALLENFGAQAVIAMENARLLGELRERTGELAERNIAFAERIDHQAATIDVLKEMSASPGDPQPVFDLIVHQARTQCDSQSAYLFRYDGLLHCPATVSSVHSGEEMKAYRSHYPRELDPDREAGLTTAIRDGRIVHMRDDESERGISAQSRALGTRSGVVVPMIRDGVTVGCIALGSTVPGGFTDSQIELLKTFAEQAVIAITSAETYRALQTRTADLQESLEYQTAISDVLKVISRSAFDLKPVLHTLGTTATRLCEADSAVVAVREGDAFRVQATVSTNPDYDAFFRDRLLPVTLGSITGRTAWAREVVQIEDVNQDPDYETPEALALERFRTCLGVPMMRDGEVIGVIALGRRRMERFAGRQIELVRTFADQAVIAIENTRLLTEQREALEQQTATAEVLRVINASPGNLQPVFDAILEKAHDLCGAATGSLQVYDGEYLSAVATHGYPEDFAALMGQPLRPTAALRRLIEGARLLHVPDLRTVRPKPSGTVGILVERAGVRTGLVVPLRKDGAYLGHISAYRYEVRPFAEKEIALLENFAAQAVIAMENARLLTEQREALERQTAMTEVLLVINTSQGELIPVFAAIVEKAMTICDCTIGALFVYDGENFNSAVMRGFPAWFEEKARAGISATQNASFRALLDGARHFHIPDLIEGLPGLYPDGQPPETTTLLVQETLVRTALAIPLRRNAALLGAIGVWRRDVRPFSDKEIALLENFAAQAVIAMENARLLTEQREALERQTATAEVLQTINANPGNLSPVFDAMLEKAALLCDAQCGSFFMIDGDTAQAVATRGLPAEYHSELTRKEAIGPQSGVARVARGEDVVHLDDMRLGPSYLAGEPFTVRTVDVFGLRTWLGVPLRKDGVALGLLAVARFEVRPFTERQIDLLKSFAAQAMIAMDNARLLNEIRQRQSELNITFENMGDGVAMFDRERKLAAWNRNFQDILDLPDDAVHVGLPFDDYIRGLADKGEYGPDADADEQIARLTALLDQANRFERIRPNGRVIDVRQNPIPDGGFVIIYADITERKRAEEALRTARDDAETALRDLKVAQASLVQAEKMASLGQLTAGIAHEIKNPLNFVNNFAALSVELLDELKEVMAPVLAMLDDDARADADDLTGTLTSNLHKIEEHGKRADSIVRGMLEHSRGSTGERRAVDLNELVEEALNLAYHGARARDQSFNITLERDYAAGILPIEVAPQDLTRVFLNLFGNGFDAARTRQKVAPAGFEPKLKVSTRDRGDSVEIRVRDNGTGVPPEIRDKLFQPFFTTKPTGEGTGLGLSISYDIVTQQHGGSIVLDSEPNVFTEFTVTIPRGMASGQGGTP